MNLESPFESVCGAWECRFRPNRKKRFPISFSDPVKQMYLVFSEDCPHCHKVIEALRGCTKCEFHFNPVKGINREVLPGLDHNEAYSPRINTMALKLSGIDTIPVLIARNVDGLTFIRGEKNIITFIQNTCFQATSSIDPQKAPSHGSRRFPSRDTCRIFFRVDVQ